MTLGLSTIVIASYQHAQYVGDAIESALAQTAPVEVIVVDDGSTDNTPDVLARYGDRIRVLSIPHGGPSVARNAGLEAARGEFLQFLDADDVIERSKVADQLAEFTPEVGWVLCDVSIHDEARGQIVAASKQYHYETKGIGGWIRPLLAQGPFIPIMAPLVRRSVLEGIRFQDRLVPEDYHFWCAVADVARVRYLPKVLATYRHRKTGRSRLPKASRHARANITHPLRLNLGCGTQGTRSWHPIDGMVNLDKSLGWTFEGGLGEFIDRSVAAITVSHSLMYVAEKDWPSVFSEFARVLDDSGVIRITEDSAVDRASSRVGGWKGSQPAVTLTSPELVCRYLERAGFVPYVVTKNETRFRDDSLKQAQHGDTPDVFFVEGVKPAGVFFAPHSDDETLFGAFTILKYRPRVVVCFPSAGDYGETSVREAETRDAMTVLGAGAVEQWNGGDLVAQMRAFDARVSPARVWAPDRKSSHPDHVSAAEAARSVYGGRVTTYHTYVNGEKIRSQRVVPFEPAWVSQKLRALARYESQLKHPRAHQFFLEDLREYYGEGA